MSGFNGIKFYANCCLILGFLFGSYNLYELFQFNLAEMSVKLLTLGPELIKYLAFDSIEFDFVLFS